MYGTRQSHEERKKKEAQQVLITRRGSFISVFSSFLLEQSIRYYRDIAVEFMVHWMDGCIHSFFSCLDARRRMKKKKKKKKARLMSLKVRRKEWKVESSRMYDMDDNHGVSVLVDG